MAQHSKSAKRLAAGKSAKQLAAEQVGDVEAIVEAQCRHAGLINKTREQRRQVSSQGTSPAKAVSKALDWLMR